MHINALHTWPHKHKGIRQSDESYIKEVYISVLVYTRFWFLLHGLFLLSRIAYACFCCFSSASGLPVDTVQWDLCHLPMRTSSVDIIVTDMPFGKRCFPAAWPQLPTSYLNSQIGFWLSPESHCMFSALGQCWHTELLAQGLEAVLECACGHCRIGSRKKNWDLYPSCLREMARVCRPGTGKAVLLTQDKKCFQKVTFHPDIFFIFVVVWLGYCFLAS